MELKEVQKVFTEIYMKNGEYSFHSPGRVNLIGEHIDYNGGFVFPCALEFGTYAVVAKRDDNVVNLASTNFSQKVKVSLSDIRYDEKDDWANYPKGIFKIMIDMGYKISGMDILVSGNIPNGAGLSSSASLELLMGVIVNNLFNDGEIDRLDLVKIGQEAENKFVGVNCGIMDQFAVGMGKKNKAMLLDCSNLDYKYASVELQKYTIVIMNTNKRRALNESKYNERRGECEEALKALKKRKNINNLCELSPIEFEEYKDAIKNPIVSLRASHAVYENDRVKKAFKALNDGKLMEFGALLTESHMSLKEKYEVTGIELDTICETSLKAKGCIGARMTGAGFGGCAIALVHEEHVEDFINEVTKDYEKIIGYKPSFYISGIGEGTCEI